MAEVRVNDVVLAELVAALRNVAEVLGGVVARHRDEVDAARKEARADGIAEGRRVADIERVAVHPAPPDDPVEGILGVLVFEIRSVVSSVVGRKMVRLAVYVALGGWVGGGGFMAAEAIKESAEKVQDVVTQPHEQE